MARHAYKFNGGEELTTMGAAWFVSYYWYNAVDKEHKNWQCVSTYRERISAFNRTKHFHEYWLEQITKMNERNLDKNAIKLKGSDVINMAMSLLKTIRKK